MKLSGQQHKIGYWGEILLMLGLCLPLLWINVRDSHDWGGDFAMYLQQTENLVSGAPQTSTGYVYNEAYPMLGPKVYPVGLPLVLSPVYAVYGHDLQAYGRWLSLWLIALGLLMYRVFRLQVSALSAVLLCLIVLYNPWTLQFKAEIMSEIPFGVWSLGAYLWFVQGKSNGSAVLAGVCGGMALATRSIGLALLVGIALFVIMGWGRRKLGQKALIRGGIAVGIAWLLSFLLNRLIFSIPSGSELYQNHFDFASTGQTILHNTAYYFTVLESFFRLKMGDWRFIAVLTQAALLVFTVIGGMNRWMRGLRLLDWWLLAYVGMLLVYPYQSSGFRFLFPMIPFLLVYAVEGFEAISWAKIYEVPRPALIFALGLIILLQYPKGIQEVIHYQDVIQGGPQQATPKAAFHFIQTQIPEETVITFTKPRVLAFYTGRKGFCNPPDDTAEEVKASLEAKGIQYVLWEPSLHNPGLAAFLKEYPIEEVWKKGEMVLYKKLENR